VFALIGSRQFPNSAPLRPWHRPQERAGGVVEQFVARPSAAYGLLLRGILDDPLRRTARTVVH
jgi:hypothetical protein